MASRPTSALSRAASAAREKSYFEQQREALIGEIAMSFEHVLANINKLNRSLEAVIALTAGAFRAPAIQVGNEFSSVEALWSQFENVISRDPDEGKADDAEGHQGEGDADRTAAAKSEER
ncbi:hypothetical protein DL769_003309 [Monosporascus sp. CRB-8-3]|nr:hypothetical protein DL769_003309 [Monosporascus sp. CRB-8-3]